MHLNDTSCPHERILVRNGIFSLKDQFLKVVDRCCHFRFFCDHIVYFSCMLIIRWVKLRLWDLGSCSSSDIGGASHIIFILFSTHFYYINFHVMLSHTIILHHLLKDGEWWFVIFIIAEISKGLGAQVPLIGESWGRRFGVPFQLWPVYWYL